MIWTRRLGALLAAAILLLAGCPSGDDNSGTGEPAPQVITGGELHLPLALDRTDPVLTQLDFSDSRMFALARCIGMPLVRSDSSGALSPGLATSWESTDFANWTFRLESLPGRAAEPDFAATLFDRRVRALLSGEAGSLRAQLADLIDGAAAYQNGTATEVAGISSDGATLAITLTRPFAQFPLWLSQPGLHLVAANPFAQQEADAEEVQPFCALFNVVSVSDTAIYLNANPDSLPGRPNLDALSFALEPDPQRQLELFLEGSLDAASLAGNEPVDIDPESGMALKFESAAMILGFFNLSHFPWQDSQFQSKLGLRQAVNYGLNLATVAEECNERFAPWPHFLPEALKDNIPAGLVRQPTFPISEQIEDARAALRRADHWQGSHLIPGMDLSYLKYQQVDDVAVSILEFWNDISVAMRPHQTDMEDLRVRVELGTHEIILNRFAPAYADAGAYAYPLLYSKFRGLGGNWSMLVDEQVDELILGAQSTDDSVLREKKFQQLCQYLEDNALLVFVGYATPSLAVSNKLAGLDPGPYDFDASLPGQDFATLGIAAE